MNTTSSKGVNALPSLVKLFDLSNRTDNCGYADCNSSGKS